MPATGIAALPMYALHRAGVEALWRALAERLRGHGLHQAPASLAWPDDTHAHWCDPGLLLSQACGYPLVTFLKGQVRVVGAFRYDAPGCDGIRCRSQVVVRDTDRAGDLTGYRGKTVAYNSLDSQSGYNSLRALVAPLAREGRFFGSHLESGGHLKSVLAVRDGRADIASIDCVSLAEFRRHAPEAMRGIRVLCETAPYPGLPLVTAANTSDSTLAVLRSVLEETVADRSLVALYRDLFITGFEVLDASAYQPIVAMRDAAFALQVREL